MKPVTTGTILDKIVADVEGDLEESKRATSMEELKNSVAERDYHDVCLLETCSMDSKPTVPVLKRRVALIVEIKKASPSRPKLALDLDHVKQARLYLDGGASGISVITEQRNFKGSLNFLAEIRKALGARRPALLRKDFLFDPYQLWEAKAYGADVVLLIVAILEQSQLVDLILLADEIGLDALVEVHNEEEVERALEAKARVIGINNRDLRDFSVNLATTERLRKLIPSDRLVVSESGIHTKEDANRLADCGVQALLIGEALVVAEDVTDKMREFLV